MGMFDITPADPLQTQQDFRQTMARTAALELAVPEAQQRLEQGRVNLQKDRLAIERDEKFRAAVSGISSTLKPIEKLGEIANIAIREGRASDAEKALNIQSQLAQRDAQTSLRGEIEAYRRTQAASLRIQRQQTLLPMATSEIGLEAANMTYREEFGDDMPFVKALKARNVSWSPQVAEAVREALGKQMTAAEQALAAQRAAAAATRAGVAVAVGAARVDQINTRTKQIEQQIADRRKAGAGKEASMRPIDERIARGIIRDQYPELDTKGLELAVLTLGDEAKQRQKQTGGGFSELVQQVVQENGDRFKKDNAWLFTRPTEYSPKPAAPTAAKPAAGAPALPKRGEVRKGYRYTGGDPSQASSWEKVK